MIDVKEKQVCKKVVFSVAGLNNNKSGSNIRCTCNMCANIEELLCRGVIVTDTSLCAEVKQISLRSAGGVVADPAQLYNKAIDICNQCKHNDNNQKTK